MEDFELIHEVSGAPAAASVTHRATEPPLASELTSCIPTPLSLEAACADVTATMPRATHTLNIVVAGEQGSGKSSLIYNLFGAFRPAHGAGGSRLGGLAATSLTTYQAETEGATFIFNLQKQQLDYNESAAVTSLVEGSFYVYQQAQALVPAHELPDGRVDLCLLLLPAGGPSLSLAASAASHIASAVPILPIIAKADTLTDRELQRCKSVARDCGLGASLLHYPLQPDLLADAAVEAGLAADSMEGLPCWPTCTVAGDELDDSVGRFWPVRRFPWAIIHAYSNPHSDILPLRKLLTGPGFAPLKHETEARYRRWLQQDCAREEGACRDGKAAPAASGTGTAGANGAAAGSDGHPLRPVAAGAAARRDVPIALPGGSFGERAVAAGTMAEAPAGDSAHKLSGVLSWDALARVRGRAGRVSLRY